MEQDTPQASTPPSGDGLSFIDIVKTVLLHRKLIIVGTVTVTLGVLAYMLGSVLLSNDKSYYPNVYRPVAVMLVNGQDSSGGLSSLLSSSGLSSLAGISGISVGMNYGKLAVFIARSNTVLDAIVDKFDIVKRYDIGASPRSTSRGVVLAHYSAMIDDKTGLLSISYEDKDPVFARDVVNYAVELVDKRFATIGGNKNITRKDQLEIKLSEVQTEMARLEGEIEAFQQQHGVVTVESIATEQVSTVAKVRSELIMKEMEIKTYGDISRVQDPALARLQAERENLVKLLGELEKGFSEYEKVYPTQKELPKLAIEFSHLKRDLLVQEKIYELLTQQYEVTKLQIMGADPIIQVLEPAEVLDRKTGPHRATLVVLACFISFVAFVFLAFVVEAIRHIGAKAELASLKGGKA